MIFRQFFPIFQQCATIKQSIEKSIGIPEKPKKPLTPYFRYLEKIRPGLVKDNPNVKITGELFLFLLLLFFLI